RSIFTVTAVVSPHFFAQPSRYVSKSGTKCLHCSMFRLPLSFGPVPIPVAPVAPLGDALAPPPGPPACCPIHEARTGTAAAATAPLRSVRRLMPSVVRSLVTSTSRTCSRESIPAAGAKRNNVSAIRKPAAAGGLRLLDGDRIGRGGKPDRRGRPAGPRVEDRDAVAVGGEGVQRGVVGRNGESAEGAALCEGRAQRQVGGVDQEDPFLAEGVEPISVG